MKAHGNGLLMTLYASSSLHHSVFNVKKLFQWVVTCFKTDPLLLLIDSFPQHFTSHKSYVYVIANLFNTLSKILRNIICSVDKRVVLS